jgi:hypothetical protein
MCYIFRVSAASSLAAALKERTKSKAAAMELVGARKTAQESPVIPVIA